VESWALAGTIGKELLVGAAFAYAVGAIYAALQVAGSLLDLTMGFSFAASIDPINGNQSAVIQNAYGLVGTLIFLTIGGEEWLLRGLAHTYDVVGLTNAPPLGGLVQMVTEAFAGIFVSAIQVAGPVLLALVLTDAAFGVVSRVVPQLNVFAMGFAVKVIVGLVLIGVSLPFVADWLSGKLPEVVVG
jgi:flagellar biosynthetic protein FliR